LARWYPELFHYFVVGMTAVDPPMGTAATAAAEDFPECREKKSSLAEVAENLFAAAVVLRNPWAEAVENLPAAVVVLRSLSAEMLAAVVEEQFAAALVP